MGEETKRFLILPTTLYEADISVDVLLSFSWLQELNLDIKAKDYGLQTHTTPPYFISGITWDTTRTMTESPQVNVFEIRVVPPSALGMHHRGNFQRHFCARPGVWGRVVTPSCPNVASKVPQEISYPLKNWARVWYLYSCGDETMNSDQMFIHEWMKKDLKMVEYLRHLPLQSFPESE